VSLTSLSVLLAKQLSTKKILQILLQMG